MISNLASSELDTNSGESSKWLELRSCLPFLPDSPLDEVVNVYILSKRFIVWVTERKGDSEA